MEGLPPVPTALNGLGFAYLVLIGTALTYWLWIRGITTLGAGVAFLGLLSPTMATILGALLLGEWLSPLQFLGIAIVLGSTIAGMILSRRRASAVAATPQPRAA